MSDVCWGLLSTARINRALIPAIRDAARGRLVAVASRSAESAQRYAAEWGILRAFGCYEAMIESDEVDAIYLSLPNHLHAEWAIRALEAGKHVLCEKPLALSVEEVDAMAAAAAQSGTVLAEAFMYLHHPQIALIDDWVTSGRLGTIQRLESTFCFTLDRAGNYRWDPAMGGGALWDVGVYPLSLSQWLLGGPPTHVLGHAQRNAAGVDIAFSAQMQYANGAVSQFYCGFQSPWTMGLTVIGSEGRLVATRPFNNIDPRHARLYVSHRGREEAVEEMAVPQASLYAGEVEEMDRAIVDGDAPRLSLAASRDHIRTVQALYRSAAEGAVVRV